MKSSKLPPAKAGPQVERSLSQEKLPEPEHETSQPPSKGSPAAGAWSQSSTFISEVTPESNAGIDSAGSSQKLNEQDRAKGTNVPYGPHSVALMKAYHYSGELRSIEHPKVVVDLMRSLLGTDKMISAMRARRRKPPKIFTLADGIPSWKGATPSFHHGSSLSNMRNMQKHGVGFASGEDGIKSGFFLTLNAESRARAYSVEATRRVIRDATSTEQKSALLEGEVEALTPAYGEFVLSPDTVIVDLSESGFGKNKSYEWFKKQIATGKGPSLLEGVVSDDFIERYFDHRGRPIEGFGGNKQFFALLFGAQAAIVSPKYELEHSDELVVFDAEVVSKIELCEIDTESEVAHRDRLRSEIEFATHPMDLGTLELGMRVETVDGTQGRLTEISGDRVRISALNGGSSWIAGPRDFRVVPEPQ